MEVRMTDGFIPDGSILARWQSLWNDVAAPRLVPAVDVIEHADGYHFYFEMPGLKSDSVDVRIEDDRLVVEAERKRPEWPKDAEVHIAERAYGPLRRVFAMPEDGGQAGIKASYRDGVLEVTVPKRPESKPVKVKVEVEN